MITYTEELMAEELITILNGGVIDFMSADETEGLGCNIKIIGKEFGTEQSKFMAKILQMDPKRFDLMINILDRYDNEEYWDYDSMVV